ncbi:MAG TPA: O-antigen polysaccharide polymerase Wzy, partial [Vicinamibacterales bacterium]
LVGLPLGLRSEVMFPAVGVLIALARARKTLTPAKAIAAAAVVMLTVPIVRDIRESGLRGLTWSALNLPGLNALVEMGGSLHPVEKVVRWHAEGEPYEQGASYWAPLERGAARLLPGVRTARADDDLRLMNVLVLDRIGAIGFSPVAEAYRNFGPIGVVVVIGLLGVIIGGIDTVADSRTAILLIAAVYVPLLINVRNSFVSVPAQCALGVVLAALIGVVRHIVGSVLSRPHARLVDHRSAI